MPLKIRKLKSALASAGFFWRPGKGSHTFWAHANLPGEEITISGNNGDDAKPYQIKDVRDVLRKLGKNL